MVEQKQINIDLKRTIPLFSDSVLVANIVKHRPEEKDKNNSKKSKTKKEPEGFVTLVFVDSVAQQAIARVVLPKITAENLQEALKTNIENFGKDIKTDNKESKDKKEKSEKKEDLNLVKPNNRYFG